MLVYRPPIERDTQLVWFDRAGKRLGTFGPPGNYRNFDLSPDDRRVVTAQRDVRNGVTSLYLVTEQAPKPTMFLTSGEDELNDALWSHDGRSIVYAHGGVTPAVARVDATGANVTKLLQVDGQQLYPEDWSRDGLRLVVVSWRDHVHGLAIADLQGGKLAPIAEGLRHADEARFSPVDPWVAYGAGPQDSDRWEIFLEAIPPAHGRWRVTQAGGAHPRWRPDGRELYFLAPDGTLSAVEVRRGKDGSPELSAPRPLFAPGLQPHGYFDQFAVSSDGARFLVALPAGDDRGAVLDVVLGWTARFARSVPQP